MILLNPQNPTRFYPDESSRQIMLKTIAFFEEKGKGRIKEDDHKRTWYADFIEFQKKEKLFATLLTPTHYGEADARWDTWRNCHCALPRRDASVDPFTPSTNRLNPFHSLLTGLSFLPNEFL